jgi:hypothetical protein
VARLQRNRFDCQFGTLRNGIGGDNVKAQAQRVWFDTGRATDLDRDPSDLLDPLAASALDDEVEDVSAERQLVHRGSHSQHRAQRLDKAAPFRSIGSLSV